jgi:hypothetical protein
MIVFEPTKFTQLRKDMMNRIAQKHNGWLDDSANLYEMAGLWPAQLEHDVFVLLLAELAVMIKKHDLPLPAVNTELKNFVTQLKAQNNGH